MDKTHSFFLFLDMLKIGLTGGIGSGKSTVAKIFDVLGIPVLYADDVAKELMNNDESLKDNIKKHFGEEAYKNNLLDRKYLANEVFQNTEKLNLLNSLVHPVTMSNAINWMKEQKAPYAIKEAAILFESNSHVGLDYVIGVTAPEELKIKRIRQRDNNTEAEVRQRIDRQMNDVEKMKRCDFVIHNDESQLITKQVLAIHEKLLELATSSIEK